jgi:uncharacterized protein
MTDRSAAVAGRKRCLVAWAGADGQLLLEIEAAADATVAELIAAARERARDDSIPWEQASVGIFGEACPRTAVPRDGDRIELYRALIVDPKAARRMRARRPRGG